MCHSFEDLDVHFWTGFCNLYDDFTPDIRYHRNKFQEELNKYAALLQKKNIDPSKSKKYQALLIRQLKFDDMIEKLSAAEDLLDEVGEIFKTCENYIDTDNDD